ncbi:MAG TPA: ribosomal RNA small subunit methyltransferase A [Erysipelothrix sp.]|nr:ribosomal RNA small subunit methyltransferase A [Erysipelothrix sp.]
MKIISNYSVTQELLKKYDLFAKKRLGQNFIIDPSVVKKIARDSGADSNTVVLEIGPGLGALTQQLSKVSKEVISIEIDTDMVEILNNELDCDNCTIIHQDFLEYDLNQLQDQQELVVCANVPYYITTPILFKLIESDIHFKQITMMVQKELGQRLVAQVGSSQYNALSVIISMLFDYSVVMNVDKRCFYPMPKIDSIVVALKTKELDKLFDYERFFEFVKKCFTQRRKTLVNNLKEWGNVSPILEELGYSQTIRPQELTPSQFKEIYEKESLWKT